jgi:hypothetical protein
VHAHGVDQHQPRHEPGVVLQGRLGADPAAERGADHQDVAQSALAQMAQVAPGQVRDRGARGGPRGAVPAGEHRGQGVRGGGEVPGEPGDGGRAAASVQDQHRAAGAGLVEGEGQVAVRGGGPCRRHAAESN